MSKDLDKIFKSKLENHGSSYPTDMWDNIDAAINPSKNNTRIWLLSFLVLGVVGLISGSILWRNNTDALDKIKTSELNMSEKSNSDATNELLSGLQQKKEVEVEEGPLREIPINSALSSFEKTRVNDVKERSSSQNQLNNLRTQESKTIAVFNNESSSITKENDAIGSFSLTSKKTINKRKITFTEPLLSTQSKSQSKQSISPTLLSNEEQASNGTKPTAISNTLINSSFGNSNNKGRFQHMNLSSLPSLFDLKYQEIGPLLEMEVAMASISRTDCPSWVREKLGLYLEAYYAPEYGVRSLTAKDRDSTIVAHQNSRNETEKALISYSLGARALFLTPSGISFKLGINYSQINERFTWQDPESIREITIVDTDPMTGDTLNSYVTYEYSKEVEERINRYKSIDLALLIGYEKHYRKKLSFSMNAGIYLNLIAKQRGMFLDPTGNRSWFSSDDGSYDAYKRSIGVSFFASGGLMYHWVDGIDFFAEPSLRFYTQSMTLNDYPLNQNYLVLGIHTGIRYKF